MKIKTLLILISALFIYACASVSLEDGIKKALAEDINTISAFEITDTVMIENVERARLQLDSALMTFQQQADSLPTKIEATKERLAKAEKQLAGNQFPSLAYGWESIIAQEKLTLTNQQLLLVEAEERLATTKKDLAFVDLAKASQKNDVCYYIVKATIAGEEQRFMVTPKFDILKQ